MFIFFLVVWLLIQRNTKLALKVVIAGSLSLVLGVGFIGYNPYITNTMYKGHPLYPAAGANKMDLVSFQTPKNFIGKNRLEKLLLSTFSEPSQMGDASKLKLPFTIKRKWVFANTDVRVAGFGPLFSGGIVLSLIVCLVSLRREVSKTLMTLFLVSLLMLSVLINPEAWWARYVPQLWMLPIVFSILGLSLNNRSLNFIGYGIIVVLVANIFVISSVYLFNNYKQTQAIEQQLRNISSNNQTLYVNFYRDFRSNRIRFLEWGIKYREVKELKELPCKGEHLINSQTLFCVTENQL
jgi:hypothetical protein